VGRELQELKVSASLSRHNSDDDHLDDSSWEELKDRIELICRERRYERISPMVF
jgi:hypothetical protein